MASNLQYRFMHALRSVQVMLKYGFKSAVQVHACLEICAGHVEVWLQILQVHACLLRSVQVMLKYGFKAAVQVYAFLEIFAGHVEVWLKDFAIRR